MQKITFKNAKNQSITLKETFPYLLQGLTGVGVPSITYLAQRGFQQNGVSHYGNLLDARDISFNAVIFSKDKNELHSMREEIFQVFNPSIGIGELIYDNGKSKYSINCYILEGPKEVTPTDIKRGTTQMFSIRVICPRPAWEVKKDDVNMVGFTGGVQFGLDLPEDCNPFIMYEAEGEGLILGIQGDYRQIVYEGTLDAPLLIEFKGPAVLPKITKIETDEFIEVAVELLEGECLFIDTHPDAIDVYKLDVNGIKTSAFGYINPLSTYFMLTQGENNLTFNVSSGDPSVTLYYSEQFVGV